MSITTIGPAEDAVLTERWRVWQLAYIESSRKTATQMRLLFTVILTVLAVALGVQLLST